jgi:hypothetical protein
MLRSSRTGPTKIGSLFRASAVIVGALVALFGVIAGPLFSATSASAATTGSGYTAITPYRALGTASAGTPVVAGTPATVQITSATAGEVPAGATAVVLNVTASNPTSAGYLELYPGTTAPTTATSNVNFVAGETVANLVTVPLSATGTVSVANFAGTTAVDVDVEGYYSTTGAGLYNPVNPVRVAGTAAAGTAVAANTAIPVTVTGGTIPAGATAVVVNLTAAGGTSASYLSAYAAGATPATTSSLNFTAGETVANRDIVNVGTGGQIEVYNFAGSVNVDVDVDGYYSATGASVTPLASPVRLTDTRSSTNGTSIASGGTETFNLATGGIPTTASSVAANFTVVPGTAPGYITVFPTGVTTPPTASDVNWPASSGPVANFTQADTAGTTAGSVQVYNLNSGSPIDLVIDAFGYFSGGSTTTTAAPVTDVVTAPTTPATGAVVANGSTEAINSTVYNGTAGGGVTVSGDTLLYTVAAGTATACGTVSPTTTTTSASGTATATYTAPAYSTAAVGTCLVTVTDSLNHETSVVTITQSGPPSSIAVSGNANVPDLTTSTDTISAVVTPAAGESTSGDVVSFTVSPAGTATCGAMATTTVTVPTATTGPATVTDVYTATANTNICPIVVHDTLGGSTTVLVDQTGSPTPATGSLTVTAPTTNPDSVTTGSAAFPVTVLAKDSSGTTIATDQIYFSTSGVCGSNVAVQTATTAGSDTYTYTPAATAGSCTVSAQDAITGAKTSTVITQVSPTPTVVLSGAASAAPGTNDTITATPSNLPSSDAGTPITFTVAGVSGFTGCGTIPTATAASSTPYGGSSVYTAGLTSGFCTITATEGGVVSNTFTVDQT